MGVSQHWMIHYLNAGMYEDAAKRAEEAHFMDAFDAFAERHAAAFEAIHARIGLVITSYSIHYTKLYETTAYPR